METDYKNPAGIVCIDCPDRPKATLILAHGAGAGMDTVFMNYMAEGASEKGFRVVRFEFPYMIKRRQTGTRRPPDRAPKLLAAFQQVVNLYGARPLIIGGKSMGGRMASMLAAEFPDGIDGVVCLGYPFHPPGKPDRPRVDHFCAISAPLLICQGERDPFGGRHFVEELDLPDNFQVHWLADGDHDFRPRKKSGYTHENNWQSALQVIAARFL